MSRFRSTGGAYGRRFDGQRTVALQCPHCQHVIEVSTEWRREHIGETKQCWSCGQWSEMPAVQFWERDLPEEVGDHV